jgi:hypothetical protein
MIGAPEVIEPPMEVVVRIEHDGARRRAGRRRL